MLKYYSMEGLKCPRAGFSLTGVLIASVIVGILAVAFSKMMNNQFKGQKTITESFELQNLAVLVKMALADPAKCSLALQNAAGTPVTPPTPTPVTFDIADIPISKISVGASNLVDTLAPTSQLNVTSLSLRQVVAGVPTTSSPYTMKLRIEGGRSSESYGGRKMLVEIPISVTISNFPALISCSTSVGGGGGALAPLSCRTILLPATSSSTKHACCDAGEVAIAGVVGDVNSHQRATWDTDPLCMTFHDVSGTSASLRCCKN